MADFPIDVVINPDKAISGGRRAEQSIDGIDQAAQRTQRSIERVTNVVKTMVAAFSAREIIRLVDTFTNLQNRLRLVTNSTQQLTQVTDSLLEISNRTRNSFEATTELYAKFSLGTRDLGLSQDRLLKIVESVNKAVVLSGADAAAASGGLRQLAQGLQSGTLRGDELVSVLEGLPRVAQAIADGMGVPLGALRELGSQGRITATDVIDAFEKAEQQLTDEFSTAVITVGQSFTVLQNNIIVTLGRLNEGAGVSRILSDAVLILADNVDTLVRVAIAAGIALSVNFAAKGVMVAVAAVKALSVAILANPIGAIATAAVAAVSALIAFSDQIKIGGDNLATLAHFGQASFEAIGRGLTSVVNTVTSTFPTISSTIQSAFSGVNLSIESIARFTAQTIDRVIGLFTGLGNAIPVVMSNLPAALEVVFNKAFNSILKSSAAFTNVIIDNMNKIGQRLGLPLIASVNALQIPLTESGKKLGRAIDGAIVSGIQGQKGAQKALDDIIARANQLAAVDSLVATTRASEQLKTATDELADSTKKGKDEAGEFVAKLKQEAEELGKTTVELKKMEAARLGVSAEADDLIDHIEREKEALDRFNEEAKRGQQVFDSVATATERYADKVAELDLLIKNGHISIFTYARAIEQLDEGLKKTSNTGRDVFENIEQFGIQGARNIQSAFADFLFDPFDKGLSGMLDSFVNVLKRMAAELVSSGILKGIGSMFGGGSFSSGFGSVFGGSGKPGAGGLSGFFPGFLGGSGTGLSAAAGPAVLALAVTQGLKAFAGDKRAGGAIGDAVNFIGDLPIIGEFNALAPLINGLFGRGPLKQKDSLLRGTVGAGGVGDDFLQATNFKAKGGLLRGDKIDRVIINAQTGELVNGAPGLPESGISDKLLPFAGEASKEAVQLGQLFDSTIKGFNESLRQSASDLGISSQALDGFNTWVQITSKSGEAITEAQIAEELQRIGNEMASTLMPNIEQFAQGGESAIETMSRLGSEFTAVQGAVRVLGVSLEDSKNIARNLGIEARSSIVAAFGGLESFSQKITFFADNFLTEERRLEIAMENVNAVLMDFGITVENTTVDAFGRLIESFLMMGQEGAEAANRLLEIAPAFLNARQQIEALNPTLADLSNVAGGAVRNVGSLIQAVQVMGHTFAEAQAFITGLGSSTQDAILASLGGVDEFSRNFNFVFENFVSDAEQARIVGERLNATLNKFGFDAQNITNDEFVGLINALLTTGEAGRVAANELLRLAPDLANFKQSLANMVPSQAIVTTTDAVAAAEQRLIDVRSNAERVTANQAGIEQRLAEAERRQAERAAQQEEAQARRAEEQERSRLIQTLRQQESELRSFTNRFDSLADSLRQANDNLSLGSLSPLTPIQQLEEARRQLINTRNAAFNGDADALENLPQAVESFLSASQRVNASGPAFINDFNFGKDILRQAESIAINESNAAEDQLRAIESSIVELERLQDESRRINDSVIQVDNSIIDMRNQVSAGLQEVDTSTRAVEQATRGVESAVYQLGNAILQGVGNPGITDQQIRDFVAANPHLSAEELTQVAIEHGVSASQFARATGTPIDAVNRGTGGRSVSDQQIHDFVEANLHDPMAIYNAAIQNGISSVRLANASRLTIEEINQFVRDNNLAAFAQGTDSVPRTGLALIHKGESIGPSTMPEILREIKKELEQLRQEQNEQAKAFVKTQMEASAKVVASAFETQKTAIFRERAKVGRR